MRLERALRPARILITGAQPSSAGTIELSGFVENHTVMVTEGAPIYLVALRPKGKEHIVRIRYSLPTGSRLPIEPGEEIVLIAYYDSDNPSDRVVRGLIIRDNARITRALFDDTGALPSEQYADLFKLSTGRQTTYMESGRTRGFCEAVVDHRVAVVQAGDATLTLHPGQTSQVSTSAGELAITLIDHARVDKTTCPEEQRVRLSFFAVQVPRSP